MSTATPNTEIVYPDCDGEPIAENTLQFRWIVTIHGGLTALFRDRPDVFVAGDLLWYPVEGRNKYRTAPDAMVVFGRPKGERGSYMQWREGNIPPHVVFEVLSPGNRPGEMRRKRLFYERNGVEEYYIYDPEKVMLEGYLRAGDRLRSIREMDGWTSPRLGVRFVLGGEELQLLDPRGKPFGTYQEVIDEAERERARAEAERARAEAERARAEAERARADRSEVLAREAEARAEEANARAGRERLLAEQERERAGRDSREKDAALAGRERLAAQLRALGIEPEG